MRGSMVRSRKNFGHARSIIGSGDGCEGQCLEARVDTRPPRCEVFFWPPSTHLKSGERYVLLLKM